MTTSSATNNEENTLLTGLRQSPCPLCESSDSTADRTVAGYTLDKCGSCGMVFMNPRCTPEHLDEIYTVRDEDSMIDLYSKIASADVIAAYDEKLDKLEEILPEKGRLLDFACAAGYFYELAQKKGWDASGYDIGLWAATAAEKRGLSNMFVGEDFGALFPENHFDIVYAAQVFEHLIDPGEILTQLMRVLKPGGVMYIDVPNYNTLPIRLKKDDFMLNEPPQHINYFTPATLKKMVVDGGLENPKLSSEGGLKYENLFGRPINSDIASAYGLVESNSASDETSIVTKVKSGAKEFAKTSVVNPLLYNGMKVGMNLSVIAWKPTT